MASPVTLKRPSRSGPLISLVPMIDVMMILLVFFMVTSTYLDLDMIPAARTADGSTGEGSGPAPTVMLRIGAEGTPVLRGQALSSQELERFLEGQLRREPLTRLLILPSGGATTQALISVMDQATRAGATRLRVVRLEARP